MKKGDILERRPEVSADFPKYPRLIAIQSVRNNHIRAGDFDSPENGYIFFHKDIKDKYRVYKEDFVEPEPSEKMVKKLWKILSRPRAINRKQFIGV